ncbi:hypothetical protein G6M70_09435 [Agrobacterium tumefaciens]|uniref:hypothetical protein n=1 Tax=Agrobacterium tumefaciens TaxID=358 RepID=UPI00157456E0|nr:hypothetical protein [Agrobacterium tumefaciens]NSZ00525.1 hypothetical protein [Agrobacterium tumefaciens]NSZ40188.1 hypothetical protein [Agrobacterium tumefaciens]NTB22801.1 hypothetical protein [Agrobacterium tumefaciens]NTB29311.1 hypothetical protein [Agrobacterium tumefaciens]NTB33193.1 hypothetical protein [Agrobacterium tumefaciens]
MKAITASAGWQEDDLVEVRRRLRRPAFLDLGSENLGCIRVACLIGVDEGGFQLLHALGLRRLLCAACEYIGTAIVPAWRFHERSSFPPVTTSLLPLRLLREAVKLRQCLRLAVGLHEMLAAIWAHDFECRHQ